MCRTGRLFWGISAAAAIALMAAGSPALGATSPGPYSPPPTYRADDFARGQALYILPAGENGLVNLAQYIRFNETRQRPPHSQDRR